MKQMRYNQVQFSGIVVASLQLLLPLAACAGNPSTANSTTGIHKIQHIIVIMQENRSFDSYFGTYPGADGIPMKNGIPTVCVNDPKTGQCVKPYHNTQDLNHGGPHGAANATADIDNSKMDSFIAQAEKGRGSCIDPNNPACSGNGQTDIMGYHDAHEIPNYWAYAKNFVLQDHMFEPDASSMKQVLYDDGLVQLDSDGLTIRRYYLPFGTSKHIPYNQIKAVQQWHIGLLTGKGRLWGSGDFRHWALLDLRRPWKEATAQYRLVKCNPRS
jgi:Phosphoesterase family